MSIFGSHCALCGNLTKRSNSQCAHCDNLCATTTGCATCTAIAHTSAHAGQAMRTLPHPTVAQLRETPVQYGRCDTCGGRTYDNWCPRAVLRRQQGDSVRLLAALCLITVAAGASAAVVWMNVACPANVSVPIDLVLGLPVAAAILGWAISEWLA